MPPITGKGETISDAQLEPTQAEVKLLTFAREHSPPGYATMWLSKLQNLVSGSGPPRACFEVNAEGRIVVASNVEAATSRSAYNT